MILYSILVKEHYLVQFKVIKQKNIPPIQYPKICEAQCIKSCKGTLLILSIQYVTARLINNMNMHDHLGTQHAMFVHIYIDQTLPANLLCEGRPGFDPMSFV